MYIFCFLCMVFYHVFIVKRTVTSLCTALYKSVLLLLLLLLLSYNKLSTELKNSIKIYVGQVDLELLIKKKKNPFLTVLIYNLKTTWPIDISMPFLISLDIYRSEPSIVPLIFELK